MVLYYEKKHTYIVPVEVLYFVKDFSDFLIKTCCHTCCLFDLLLLISVLVLLKAAPFLQHF